MSEREQTGSGSVSTERQREQLVEYGRRMMAERLVSGTAGNISVRHGEEEDEVLITPSSVSYETIEPGDICAIDMGGKQLFPNGRRPSSETPLHLAVYRATDAKAVVHTHSVFATTVACTMDELPAIHYAIHRFGGESITVAPYQRFGSDGLAQAAIDALGDQSAVLLGSHGAVVYGSSLKDAYDKASLLEWLAEVYWRSRLLGEPRILDGEQVDEVATAAKRARYMEADEHVG
jgi:L-fuculose-phosphate aldolase